ncbi:MAG: polysaccharide deacetylase family protein [Verrucomicrobiota bacterium]
MKIPARIEIAQFPGGKRIAVTTSFDDGVVHDRRVIQAFNEWGLKGTFNLNSGLFGGPGHVEAAEVAGLYRGHEVAVHTVSHPWLEKLDASQIVHEVFDDRQALEDLVGYPVRGMAYPFGTYNGRVIAVLRQLGIVYARTTEINSCCFPAREPLAWQTTGHQFDAKPKSVPERFAEFHVNPRSAGLFFIWGHTYEFENRWDDLEKIFKPLASKPDVWYCTNIELFDYEAARQRLVIATNRASVFNPSALPVTINVDGKLFDVPAGKTLALDIPSALR